MPKSCLVVTPRVEALRDFLAALSSPGGLDVDVAANGHLALEAVRSKRPGLIVADDGLHDFTPLDLVKEILTMDAMINTAVVSPLSSGDFHEASEGLGVLRALPTNPGKWDGEELARQFLRVSGAV